MYQKQKSLFWRNKKLIYKNAGILADVFWYEITQHAKNVELGAFVVMPNHIHGILILTESNHLQSPIIDNLNYGTINNGNNIIDNSDAGGENGGLSVKTGYPVETRYALSLQTPLETPPQSEIILQSSNGNQLIDSELENTDLTKQIKNKKIPNFSADRFQNQGKNTVSSIIGSYKTAVTKHANRLGI